MYCAQLIMAYAANAAASILRPIGRIIHEAIRLWVAVLIIMGSCSSFGQASELLEGGRTPLHADHELLSLTDETQQDSENLSSRLPKEPVAIGLLRKHRQSVASIQFQHSVVRATYTRGTSVQRLLGLIPYTAERIITFFRLMRLYIAIASLESQLMMSDRHQHQERTTTTFHTMSVPG